MTSKPHVVVDRNGLPLRLGITAGQAHDNRLCSTLLSGLVTVLRETGPAMEKLKICKDRTPALLRNLAKTETDVRVARRLLAIANALSGMSRAAEAASAGMDRQTLRDWMLRYSAHGVAGLCDLWKGGRPPMLWRAGQ